MLVITFVEGGRKSDLGENFSVVTVGASKINKLYLTSFTQVSFYLCKLTSQKRHFVKKIRGQLNRRRFQQHPSALKPYLKEQILLQGEISHK